MAELDPGVAAILRRAIENIEAKRAEGAYPAILQAMQDLEAEHLRTETWTVYQRTLERVSWWPTLPSGNPRAVALVALQEALRERERDARGRDAHGRH